MCTGVTLVRREGTPRRVVTPKDFVQSDFPIQSWELNPWAPFLHPLGWFGILWACEKQQSKVWSYQKRKVEGCQIAALVLLPPHLAELQERVVDVEKWENNPSRGCFAMNLCLCHLIHTEESSEHQSRATCGDNPNPIPAPARWEGRKKGP